MSNQYDNISIDELINMYNGSNGNQRIRGAIIGKIVAARQILKTHHRVLSPENIANLQANIAKARAAIGD